MSRGGWTDREPDSSAILSALGNKYSAEILAAAGTPKSAQALSEEIGIPIATCYRRIEDLVDAGLLECEGRKLSAEGRRTNIYRRTVDEMEIDFCGDGPRLSKKPRTEARTRLEEQRLG